MSQKPEPKAVAAPHCLNSPKSWPSTIAAEDQTARSRLREAPAIANLRRLSGNCRNARRSRLAASNAIEPKRKIVGCRICQKLFRRCAFEVHICLSEVDSMFASTISIENIIGSIVEEIISRKPELKRYPAKVVSKARSIVGMNHGERFPVSMVMQMVVPLPTE